MKTFKVVLILIVLLLFNYQGFAQNSEFYFQTIRGVVIDKNLQSPVAGATVVLLSDSTIGTIANEQGEFKLNRVKVGRHELKIIALGYKDAVLPVLVSSGKEVVLTVPLEEDAVKVDEVVIVVTKDKSLPNNNLVSVSSTNLRPEEINRFAGSRYDPSRMASNYAGVAGGGDQRNDIIVRGNSSNGVLWRLEGVDISNPNHFTFTGNTGGAFSILNNNLLANSDFLTGAFPAEYGNKTAAVFDVRLRKGNNEKREHTFQAGLNGLELVTEGPISVKSGASYLASFRLFTFEGLHKLGVNIGANGIPQFQDATVKIDVPTEKAGKFSIWGIGGKSSIKINDKETNDTSEYASYTDDFRSDMFATGISHTYFLTPHTTGKLTLSVSGSRIGVISKDNYKTGYEKLDYNLKNLQGHYLVNYTLTHRFTPAHLVKAGVTYRSIFYNNHETYWSDDDSTYRTGWDQKGTAGMLQSYVHWQYSVTEKLTLNNGLYYQLFMLNNTQALEPRMAAIYALNAKQRVRMAVGFHSQAHDLFVYQKRFYDNATSTYYQPNKNLKFTRSLHLVASYQRAITPNVRFKTEAYYQHLYKVPVSASHENGAGVYSILNTGATYNFFVPDSVVNRGTGKNYGVEFTLERYFNKNYYFLTNVSLLQSKYKGYDQVERNTAFNIGYVFNILAGKEFHLDASNKKVISVDFKVTSSGGRRYIGVDSFASVMKGHAVYEYNTAYDKQLKNYFRTDLKISYNINRPSATHNFFIAADNLFNTKNVLTKDWDNSNKKVTTYYQLGLFPYLGYRVQF